MQRKRNKVRPQDIQVNPNRGFVEQLRQYAMQEGVRGNLKLTFSQEKEKKQEGELCESARAKGVEKREYILSNPLGKLHEEKE